MKGFKNMGTLKYAILGLLNRKNMTGRNLKLLFLNSGMPNTARSIRN